MQVWAQWALLFIYFCSLLVAAYNHGKPKEGIYNFWISAIALGIVFVLLRMAGALPF